MKCSSELKQQVFFFAIIAGGTNFRNIFEIKKRTKK